jgi:hypothetical protein
LLHDQQHPVRKLIDRLGSASAGIAPDTPAFAQLQGLLGSAVEDVLTGFDTDTTTFSAAECRFEAGLSALIGSADERIGQCLAAIERAEEGAAALVGASAALDAVLAPLRTDARLLDFLTVVWARVLAHSPEAAVLYSAPLPELVWSAQEKTTAAEHAALMSLLPRLVGQVRQGLALLELSPDLAKGALDQLVGVHMDILGNRLSTGRRVRSLDQLRAHFNGFTVERASASEDGTVLEAGALQAELARSRLVVTLQATPSVPALYEQDYRLLALARPGTGFELLIDGAFISAQLAGVSRHQSAYVFVLADRAPLIYLNGALLAALQDGTVRTVEYAPVFDRAVQSLMAGAESLSPGQGSAR